MATEVDDTLRSSPAVVVCLRNLGNGQSRLIFDDVKGDSEKNPVSWMFETFCTWNAYDNKQLDEMKLSADDFKRIGEVLVARLLAINERGNPE